jgi:hypothetical protein
MPVSLNPFASPVSGAPTSGGFSFPPDPQTYESMPQAGVVIPQPAPPGTPIPAPPALRDAMPSNDAPSNDAPFVEAPPVEAPSTEDGAAAGKPESAPARSSEPVPEQRTAPAAETRAPEPPPFVWPSDDDYASEAHDNPWSPRNK